MKKFVIGFIILLVVVGLGVGGYFLWDHLSNSNDSNSNETTNSTTENNQTKENDGKLTKIIGVEEVDSDLLGKYTMKMEATFIDGKFSTVKLIISDIKDDYMFQTLKSSYEKSDIADKMVVGDKSFSFEFTAEEYAKYLKNPEIVNYLSRNYIYTNFKKSGFTVTVEGDDSFLGETNETSNTEDSTSSNSDTDLTNITKSASDYINSEELKKAEQEAKKYMNSEEFKKAEQEANEYLQNNQAQIEAAKKQAEALRKQYGL